MIHLERLLFYPAVLAATVVAVRQLLVQPSTPVYVALGVLGLIWVGVVFRVFFWFARLVFWLALLGGVGVWLWITLGTRGI